MPNEHALLIRADRLLRACLVLLALAAMALYLFVAFSRINYPYELEWMEGASVDTVARALDDLPLYSAPTTDWIAPIYGPLSYYVGAVFARIFGVGFFALRLVSLLASFGCMALLFAWARRETGMMLPAFVATGLFAAAFGVSGGWYDLARVDTLFLLFTLLAAYTLRYAESMGEFALGGSLLGLAFLTKQAALVIALPLALYALLANGRRGIPFVGAALVVGGGVSLLFDLGSGGWYRYFVLGLGQQDGYVIGRILTFWSADMSSVVLLMALAGGYWLWLFADKQRRSWGYFGALLVGALGAAYLSRLRAGGFVNVIMPLYAVLALMAALALGALAKSFGGGKPIGAAQVVALVAALCLQFVALLYSPADALPTPEDRAAGDALMQRLREQDGDVLLFALGHYAEMAGRGGARLGWLMNIAGVSDDAWKADFNAQVEAALADGRWAALVVDQAIFLSEDYQATIDRYYVGTPLDYPADDTFHPVTGLETRPLALYTRRE